jgi:peptide/nickel transport system substrate-binding protein
MDPKNETADVRNYFESVTGCEMLDEHTIQFTCSKPYFKHLDMIGGSLAVFPKHIYGEGDFNTHPANRAPVGSGPYVFESWETNQQVTFNRNPNYWRETHRGYVDKMVTRFIVDDTAAFQGLRSHDFDTMEFLPEIWVTQTAKPEFQAEFYRSTQEGRSGYTGSYNYIAWNMRKPMFSDKRVRQALTMLLPRQLIVDEIFYGLGRVHTGPAAYQEDAYDKTIEPWPFDPEAAKAKLDEAGWVDSNGNGTRDKDGVEFQFEFMMPSGLPEYEQIATIFKEELSAAGIRMDIRPLEWAAMIDRLVKRSFDSVTLAWAVPLDQDPYQVWHSSQGEHGSNYPGFNNPEADRMLEEARLEFDKDKRSAIYRDFHALIHEEQPYTIVLSRPRLVAVDKRFHGVNVYALGLLPLEWWVKTDQRRH